MRRILIYTATLALILGVLAGCTGSVQAGSAQPDITRGVPSASPVPAAGVQAAKPAATSTPTAKPSAIAAPALTATPTPAATSSPTATDPAAAGLAAAARFWPTIGWRTSTSEDQGMDSQALADIIDGVMQQGIQMHSLLVVRHGYIVAEAYFYPYGPDVQHDQWSITKGVTSALTGIAVKQGLLRLDQPVLASFPDLTPANPDPRKQAITVENLLDMTAGFAWDETSQPYGSPGNSETQMTQSKDWVQFVLDRPMSAAPGAGFDYDSGEPHLLSALIQRASGMSELDYALKHLFGPLGISSVTWSADPQGVTNGAVGLSLTPRDMAKIGYLYLHDGVWDGQQVLPPGWVAASTRSHPGSAPNFGYQWRMNSFGGFQAIGYGSQIIGVLPSEDLVLVATGGIAPGAPGAGSEEMLFRQVAQQAVRSDGPLTANPGGDARLASLEQAAGKPTPRPVPPLPDTARKIDGKTYVLDAPADGIHSFSLAFGAAEAMLNVTTGAGVRHIAVGLDNVYRSSETGGEAILARGYWKDANTFVIERRVLGAADMLEYTLTFTGDRVDGKAQAAIEWHMVEIHGKQEQPPLPPLHPGAY